MESNEHPLAGNGVLFVVVTLGMVVMAGLQTLALWTQGSNLVDLRTAQAPAVAQSVKVRAQLDAVAGGAAKLANSGNASAKTIIDELKRQGVTVKPAP